MVARSSDGSEGRWSFPSLTVLPLDRTRVRNLSGAGGCDQPRVVCPDPTFLVIALRDGGPSARRTAGCPRSGRGSRAQLAVEPTGGDQSNILPLDLTL